MKKILVTGNLGYVGSYLGKYLSEKYEDLCLIGYDIGFFSNILSESNLPIDHYYFKHYFCDIRDFDLKLLNDLDGIINLAAISNDPMGSKFELVTEEINRTATVQIIKEASQRGVKNIVFASSCSMYGSGSENPKSEKDDTNPLTAYARSKIGVENDLIGFDFNNSIFTALRFSTACGFTPRTRLDLVLNDFVISAIKYGKIDILSDGSPWRPLIHVHDMCRAIDWALHRDDEFNSISSINIGSKVWNYQVKDLAKAVALQVGNVQVNVNPNAPPDKRSYQVDFSLFEKIAPNHQPEIFLENAIEDLIRGLKNISLNTENFRDSKFIRLKVLEKLINEKIINTQLRYLK